MPRSFPAIAPCIALSLALPLALPGNAFAGSFVDYYKVGIGYTIIPDFSVSAADVSGPLEFDYSSENGYAILLAAGLKLNEWSFLELQLQQNDRIDLSGTLIDEGVLRTGTDISVETNSLLVSYQMNINRFLRRDDHVDLYVGLGAGAANNKTGKLTVQDSSASIPSGSNIDFAYRLTAGIVFPVTDALFADIAYSYSNYGSTEEQDFGPNISGQAAPFLRPFQFEVEVHEIFFSILF